MQFLEKINLKAVLIIGLLSVGLAVTVLLVQNQQIFRSRANADALIITGNNGDNVNVEGSHKFNTEADSITISIKKKSALE